MERVCSRVKHLSTQMLTVDAIVDKFTTFARDCLLRIAVRKPADSRRFGLADTLLEVIQRVRNTDEAACHADLQLLARSAPDLLDLHVAFSRQAGAPARYVQDAVLEHHETVAKLLGDGRSCIYLCGLKGMEAGVLAAFEEVCRRHGMQWGTLRSTLVAHSRLHIETY